MSSTRTQSHFFTTTPISSFIQCHISFRPFPFVDYNVYLIKVFVGNHMSVAEWDDI